jgi:hypothetical protein
MDMERVFTRRKPVEIELDENAGVGFLQIDPADFVAFQVDQVGTSEQIGLGRRLRRLSEGGRRGDGKKCGRNANNAKHVELPGSRSRGQRAANRIVQSKAVDPSRHARA